MSADVIAAIEQARADALARREQVISTIDVEMTRLDAALRALLGDDSSGARIEASQPPPQPSPGMSGQRGAVRAPAATGTMAERVKEHLRRSGPARRRDLLAEVGGSADTLNKVLRQLRRAGVVSVGVDRPWVYTLAGAGAGSEPPATKSVVCEGADQLLELIREQAPVSLELLHGLTGCDYVQLNDWKRELLRRQAIVVDDGDGRRQVCRIGPPRDLRALIVDTIGARPGDYNERQLALALRAPSEVVDGICIELFDGGVVDVDPNGRYRLCGDLEPALGAA